MTSEPRQVQRAQTPGLHVGHVRGVPVVLTWSLVVVAVVLTMIYWREMGNSSPTTFIMAASFVVALFISVFLHELAHGLIATAFKVRVREYVLTFWGGHTSFTGEMPGPGVSAAVSAAGPVANLAIAGICYLIGHGASMYQFPSNLFWAILGGVAWSNLFLGLFNLIPADPLDGGALVEALVWKVTGRRSRGMIVAGLLGLAVAVAIVVYAFRGVFTGQQISYTTGIWGLFFALLVGQGAWTSFRTGQRLERLDHLSAPDVMHSAIGLPQGTTVAEATGFLAQHPNTGIVVVAPDGRSIGYVDSMAFASVPGALRATTFLDAVMVALPSGGFAISAQTSGINLLVAAQTAVQHGVALIPVVNNGWVVGLISPHEVAARLH